MALRIFDDKTSIPNKTVFANKLGKNPKLWEEIVMYVFQKYPVKNYDRSFRLKEKTKYYLFNTAERAFHNRTYFWR